MEALVHARRDVRGKKVKRSLTRLRTQRAPRERTNEIIDPTLRDQLLDLIMDFLDRSDQYRFSREAWLPGEKIVVGMVVLLMPQLQNRLVPVIVCRLGHRERLFVSFGNIDLTHCAEFDRVVDSVAGARREFSIPRHQIRDERRRAETHEVHSFTRGKFRPGFTERRVP